MANFSVSLPATSDNGAVASSAFMNVMTNFSVSFWWKTTDFTSFSSVLGKTQDGTNGFSLLGDNSSGDPGYKAFFVQINKSGANYRYDASGTFYDGVWHNVLVTYSNSTGTSVYKDGVQTTTNNVYNVPITTITNAIVFKLGSFAGGVRNTGSYAALKTWNTTLTLANAVTLAAGGDVATGKIADWEFTEGSGLTAADTAGGNTLTFTAVTWSADIPTQLQSAAGSSKMLKGVGA